MKGTHLVQLIGLILLSEFAGIIGSFFTYSAIPTWYVALAKPSFTPPSWLFGPVWTILFALMGVAAFFVIQKGSERKDVRCALGAFGIQLFLNVGWSVLFFGLRNPFYGFIEIIVLWLAIVATMVFFYRIARVAGYLLLPYLLWVSFAAYLNWWLWQLNPLR